MLRLTGKSQIFLIIQNPNDITQVQSYFIPHWLQPGIIERDYTRGSRIETIGYFGLRSNIATELLEDDFIGKLLDVGLRLDFRFKELSSTWQDYSQVDLVLAIRSLELNKFNSKPSSKLINSWFAGVPVLVGAAESAYISIYKSKLDFISIQDINGIFNAINDFRKTPSLYYKMVENGKIRSREFSSEVITKMWKLFFEKTVFPAFHDWRLANF